MFYILCIVLFVCIIYLGDVIALSWQCEYIPGLAGAKKYVWVIPLLVVKSIFDGANIFEPNKHLKMLIKISKGL